jgi:SAM-dependent methyltransferase
VTDPVRHVPTATGSVVVTSYGLGVEVRGIYTPMELFALANSNVPAGAISTAPVVFDGYYNYAWCPWARRSVDAFTSICERTRMVTQLRLDIDDVHTNYAGTGKAYKEAWFSYYPTETRLNAITRGLRVRNPGGIRLLDLGCAGGRHLLPMHAHGIDVYGIEANPEHLRDAPDLVKDRVIAGDALVDTFMFKKGMCEVIICSVLGTTAFPDLPHLFRECARLLVQNGIIILDVPPRQFNIGPGLASGYTVYMKVLRNAGFQPLEFTRHQLIARKK